MKNKQNISPRTRKTTNILFCGDVCLNDSEYSISKSTVDLFRQSDFKIMNLEAPILSKEKTKHPLPKAGPNLFQTPESVGKLSRALDINYFGGANNHISDYGMEGIESTQKFLRGENINFFGAGKNKDEAKKYVNLTSEIVVLAAAEDEFGVSDNNQFGYYSLYNNEVIETIENLKRLGKTVIIYGHGGGEEIPLPPRYLRDRYKELIDSGAKIIVSHHPHIPQGYEKYKDGLIYYSLGNFVHASYKKSYGNILSIQLLGNKIVNSKLYAVDSNLQNIQIRKLNKFEQKYLNTINSTLNDQERYKSILNIQSTDMFNMYYKSYFSKINFENGNTDILLLLVLLRNNSHREFILNALNVLTDKEINGSYLTDKIKYKILKLFIRNKLY